MWPLFPTDLETLPFEPRDASARRVEFFGPADPDDTVARMCAPGDVSDSWYYNVSQPRLAPFILGPGQSSTRASVIVVPGGGNRYLSWRKEGTQVAKWLNSIGISAFVLKYRVVTSPVGAQRYESFLRYYYDAVAGGQRMQSADIQRAVSVLRDSAHRYGLRRDLVGVLAFDTGGAAAVDAAKKVYKWYAHVDEVDEVSHTPDFALFIYPVGGDLANLQLKNSFVAVAQNDPCAEPFAVERQFYYMGTSNANTELHVYDRNAHGFGDCSLYVPGGAWQPSCAWVANAELFIKDQVLGDKAPLDEFQHRLPMPDLGRTFLTK